MTGLQPVGGPPRPSSAFGCSRWALQGTESASGRGLQRAGVGVQKALGCEMLSLETDLPPPGEKPRSRIFSDSGKGNPLPSHVSCV